MNPDVCLIYNPADLPPNVPVVTGNFTSGSVLPNGIPVSVPVITAAAPGAVLVDSQGNTFVATTAAAPPTPSGVVIDPQQQAPPPQMMIDTYSNLYAASTTFAVAPGAEHSAHKLQQQQNMSSTTPAAVTTTNNGHQHHAMDSQSQKKIVMDYESDFPTLAPIDNQNVPSSSASTWSNQNAKPMMSVKSTTVTQVFHFPADERRHLNMSDQGFGDKSQEQDECNNISLKTGTSIDLCQNKDSSLTIVVSGKRANVEEARKWIVQSLQTQCHREIRIPKDHYKILIGREGKNLQALEKETDCRIMIPNRDTPSEMIKIIGPKEGIEKAIHKIQLISDEQSKLAQEHLTIPKVFYPFIRGPYNEIIDQITHETGARVNIPPSTAASEIIVVTGEKEGVHRAVAVIKKIYEEKKNSQTVAVQIDKKQHKFIIGHQRSGLAEILKETGVSVEVPPEDSNSNEITLRGDGTKLGAALALVYTKASSILPATIECPSWLHRYIIGPKGSGIRAIVGEDENGGKSQVQVSFEEGQIFLEGPAAETKRVRDDLTKIVKDLQAEYTFEILHIDQNFHRHVIGRSGSNISKIRQETGVNISIPADDSNSDEIRIDGKKTGVAQAKAEIMELVKKMENEKSRDIVIENRFHRLIIGTKGESIRELRDKFPGVNVQFPEPGRKTDIVSLRGPKEEVDKCHKHLQNLTKELKENNYQERIQIFKEFHPHIIGKGGVNIKKIRDETDTKIELPLENSTNDVITVTGKRVNVDKAKEMLRKLEGELASVITAEISVPHKIHSSLIGGGGRLIQHIAQTECGGVQIKFPSEKTQSDKITIRGHKEGVEKAKKMLTDLAKDRELTGYTAEVKAKPELFRFLIGRGGSKIHKLRESNPKVKIMLPRSDDADQETIHIVGCKEDVEAAKKQLELIVTELNDLTEIHVDIDPRHHRHFVGRGATVIHEVQDQCGGVVISFPKQNTNSSAVSVKGGKECCESAKKRLLEIVDDLESQVTIKVVIPQRHHGQLLSNRGAKIQEITHRCNVQIKFPERGGRNSNATTQSDQTTSNSASPVNNTATSNGHDASPNGTSDATTTEDENATDSKDIISITGRPEKCEEAKELLIAEIPVSETVNVPFDFHRILIGRNGAEIRKLMDRHHVFIRIPQQEEHSDEITVTGSSSNVAEAISSLMAKVEELEEEAKEKELKSFQASVIVPAEYHSKLIGPKGSEINRIRQKFDVQITIPLRNSENVDEIIITGFEKNANECKEEIERIISEYKSLYTIEVTLDSRIHNRIIGQRGRSVRKIMDDFGVEIRFPRSTDPNPNLIVITGKNEETVYDCIDHLRNLEEEYLQDIAERYRDPQRSEPARMNGSALNVDMEIAGRTPWSASGPQIVPDMSNMSDFPSMGGENGGIAPAAANSTMSNPKWGRQQR